MQKIHWEQPESFITGSGRRITKYPVTCDCGRTRWLTKSDALRCKVCGHCQRRAAGAATAAKYGQAYYLKIVKAYREANPTRPELFIRETLQELGYQFQPEYLLITPEKAFLIDIWITTPANIAVEFNSYYYHTRPDQQRRDQAKQQALKRLQIPFLILTEDELPKTRTLIQELMQ